MSPQIDNPNQLYLPSSIEKTLIDLFHSYHRFVIFKEITGGLSGGRVFEIQPIPESGFPELPAIVKVSTNSLTEKEWRAYQKFIRHRLYNAASITAEPVYHASGWGALRYTLTGGGAFEVFTLREYLGRMEVTTDEVRRIFDYLLRNMNHFWRFNKPTMISFSDSYDAMLPVNLLIEAQFDSGDQDVIHIDPEHIPAHLPVSGSKIRLFEFAISKVDATTRTITLQIPESKRGGRTSFFVRCRFSEADFPLGLRFNDLISVFGKVIETRTDRLIQEAKQLFGESISLDNDYLLHPGFENRPLYNPLHLLPNVLTHTTQVNTGTIHGDFNLGNILIEPENKQLTLIDFADARVDHVLHDILRLETEIITWMLPPLIPLGDISPIQVLANLYRHLHFYQLQERNSPPETLFPFLHKPWVILNSLRQFARHYFVDANDPHEFYRGLLLYMLGALKYKNLASDAKRLAFWGGVLCYHLLIYAPEEADALLRTFNDSPNPLHLDRKPQDLQNTQRINELKILAQLPLDHIPHLASLPAFSRMPLTRNTAFVGRIQELKTVAKAIKDGKTVAVTGLGGIGKSQFVSEFVYRYGQFFSGGVFWLSFANSDLVPIEFAVCGSREYLNLSSYFEQLPLEEQLTLVLGAWEQPTPRLLIFDNCESIELFEKWRPKSGGSRVIITSRRSAWEEEDNFMVLALNILERQASLNLLRAYYPVAGDAILDSIAHDLGDLPLALDLAGRYLARYQTAVKPEQYLAQLREPRFQKELLEHHIGVSPTAHVRNVNRTFAISYEQLNLEDPIDTLAVAFLKTASCLAPGEPIPLKLLKRTQPTSPSPSPFDAETKALARLVELGLIRKEENLAYRLHRLLAAYIHNQEKEITFFQQSVESALSSEVEQINQRGRPIELQHWQSHLRYVTDMALQRESMAGVQLGAFLAEHLFQSGDYVSALSYYERNVGVCQKIVGDINPLTAKNLADLGNIHLQLGALDRAWQCLEQALTIQLEIQGEIHADTAITLNNMGFLLQSKGDLTEASRYHQRALRTRQHLLGWQHPDTAESLVNLAYISFQYQQWAETKENLLQALAIYREQLGEDHHRTISVLEYLGEVARAEKDWKKAENFFTQVLTDRLRILGENHRATARVLEYLGEACASQDDLGSAQAYYERTLHIRHLVLGANHPSTLEVQKKIESLKVEKNISG